MPRLFASGLAVGGPWTARLRAETCNLRRGGWGRARATGNRFSQVGRGQRTFFARRERIISVAPQVATLDCGVLCNLCSGGENHRSMERLLGLARPSYVGEGYPEVGPGTGVVGIP